MLSNNLGSDGCDLVLRSLPAGRIQLRRASATRSACEWQGPRNPAGRRSRSLQWGTVIFLMGGLEDREAGSPARAPWRRHIRDCGDGRRGTGQTQGGWATRGVASFLETPSSEGPSIGELPRSPEVGSKTLSRTGSGVVRAAVASLGASERSKIRFLVPCSASRLVMSLWLSCESGSK